MAAMKKNTPAQKATAAAKAKAAAKANPLKGLKPMEDVPKDVSKRFRATIKKLAATEPKPRGGMRGGGGVGGGFNKANR